VWQQSCLWPNGLSASLAFSVFARSSSACFPLRLTSSCGRFEQVEAVRFGTVSILVHRLCVVEHTAQAPR